MNGSRNVTVGKRYRKNRWTTTYFPEIRIAGQWLSDELGITFGDCLEVYCDDNALIIRRRV